MPFAVASAFDPGRCVTRSATADLRAWNLLVVFFSSRRRHTRLQGDWSSDVCSSDLGLGPCSPWQTRHGGGPAPRRTQGAVDQNDTQSSCSCACACLCAGLTGRSTGRAAWRAGSAAFAGAGLRARTVGCDSGGVEAGCAAWPPSWKIDTACTSCCACVLRLAAAAALSSTSAAFCCVTWSIWLTALPTCATPALCSSLALLISQIGRASCRERV